MSEDNDKLILAFKDYIGKPKTINEASELRYKLVNDDLTLQTTPIPIINDGSSTIGYILRISCPLMHPNDKVSIQLDFSPRHHGQRIHLTKFEWNPVRVHTNPEDIPEHAGARVEGSHVHEFEKTWSMTLMP